MTGDSAAAGSDGSVREAGGHIAIRDGDPDDLPQVELLCTATLEFETRADATAFPGVLTRRDATFLVATDPSGSLLGAVIGSVNERQPERGHLELVVVDPGARRRGIGRSLVEELAGRLRGAGCRELVTSGNPPWYCWPGVDVRYTAAVCLLESAGFEYAKQMKNMTARLRGEGAMLDTTEDEERLGVSGVTIRRLESTDEASIRPWLAGWGGAWEQEALGALRYDPVRCHVALREGSWLGFAAWGVNAPSWFGPMGTSEAARGQGIGAVLLRRCLADQYVDRLDHSQIGWIGPYRFYSRAVGAYISRIFWSYRKALT